MAEENPDRKEPQQQMPNRFGRSLFGWVMIICLGLLLLLYMSKKLEDRRQIAITDFWAYAENGDLTGTVTVLEKRIEGELRGDYSGLKKGESPKFYVIYNYAADEQFSKRLEDAVKAHPKTFEIRYDIETHWYEGLFTQLLIMVLVFVLIWFLLFRRLGAGGAGGGFLGSFGRSRHRLANQERPKVTFSDVAGIEEAKDEVAEVIEFLKNPRKFQRLGGRVPRGVLLIGEPGCGKTLLAKAIAGEADVPFFSISGSDFVEMFVGVGASRVRDLFKQAKDTSPCIIFLDEIDAVGRRRGLGFNGGGHDEREQTLNAILVEMDGFDSSDQVIVIAATNRSDVLDPALTRPGRFDRQINVPLPDLRGRAQILKIYLDKVRCGPDVDASRLARGTPMFSGADLAAVVNEAAIAATMANKEFIEQADMEEARDKVRWGRARKSRVIDEKEKEITAYHEAGHAVVQMLTPGTDPLHKVSIIPRGPYGGATFSLPEKDRYIYTKQYCNAQIAVMFGGRLSEEMFCDDISSGAASDIAYATDLARKMVLDWGMSVRLGAVKLSSAERNPFLGDVGSKEYSEKTAEMVDQEIKAMLDEACQSARKLIEDNRQKVKDLAQALLKYETLGVDDVKMVLEGKPLDKPTVGDLLDMMAGPAPAGSQPAADSSAPQGQPPADKI
ncbi:MAG: ATP-dependent zinc metalloprotease FtsH [Planctomycetes bacterium]|nr:ATP-dependent zinc metalloprotease FtsH [Planctomycetota bacterium]